MNLEQAVEIFKGVLGDIFSANIGGGSVATPLKGYLVTCSSFFSFFAYYIAAPSFVALLLWYFFSYVTQLHRGQEEGAASFFFKRALLLLLALILIVPASASLGVDDKRPTAMWAVFKAAEGGMEWAGKAVTASTGLGGSDITAFLLLPKVTEDFVFEAKQNVEQAKTELEQATNNDNGFQSAVRAVTGFIGDGGALGFFTSLLGGLLTMTGIGAAVGLPLVIMGGVGMAHGAVGDAWLSGLGNAIADSVFSMTLTFGFYAAICVLVIRVMLYGFLGAFSALMIPMGRWGQEKIQAYFINVLALILTPVMMVIGFFIGLVVRAMYFAVQPVIYEMIKVVVVSPTILMVAQMAASFLMPFFFVMPVIYLFFRAPGYLSNVLGNLFSAQTGVAERIHPPMAK